MAVMAPEWVGLWIVQTLTHFDPAGGIKVTLATKKIGHCGVGENSM
jgi:hypothetical protein